MSVLIKGMKPPKSCYVCSWYNKVPCPVSDGKCYYRNERHPSCPLIELPFAEELAEKLYKQIEKAVIEGSETE